MARRLLGFLLALLLLPAVALAEAPPDVSSADIESAVTQFLQAQFQKHAEQSSDGWERYIYEQGVADVTMDLEKFDIEKGKPLSVTFAVTGGQPQVKTQPKYGGDPDAWLKGVVDAMSTRDASVKTSLAITAQDGSVTVEYAAKAEAALQKSVKAIATKASKAFADKTIQAAVTDYLMPTPIAVPKKAPSTLHEADYQSSFKKYVSRNGLELESDPLIPALLYGLKGYKLDVSGGPEAFVFTYTAPDFATLIDEASTTLARDLSYDTKAKEYESADLTKKLAKAAEKDIIAYRHSKKADQKESYSFSLLSLPETLDPQAFYAHLDTPADSAFGDALTYVQARVFLMPDYPAVPTPKTGLISGGNKGTKCIFKAYADGYLRCVSVYECGTDKLYSTLFIESGKTATIRIPKGAHYFVIGIGEVWYGEEHLFGTLGGYSKTEDITIADSRYYHTFTLNPKSEGNTDLYGLSYDDLFN